MCIIFTMRKEIACGTFAGYRRHGRRNEESCADCRAANAARQSEYYSANQEKIYQINRAWAKRNSDKVKSYARRGTAKRKALKLSNGHKAYTEDDVIKLHGYTCHICLRKIDPTIPRHLSLGLHFDHVIALAKGGRDSIENIKPSHAACNIRKKNK